MIYIFSRHQLRIGSGAKHSARVDQVRASVPGQDDDAVVAGELPERMRERGERGDWVNG